MYGMPLYVDIATATTGIGWLKGISLCEVLIQGYDIQTCALGAHSIGESMQASNAGIKLSIIVPCYKVEKYLPKCLDSLMAQTLEDIEVICINDGSPDRCIDILNDYRDRYGSKIVIIDKKNEGVWKGRWDGIAVAQGEYIGFLVLLVTPSPTSLSRSTSPPRSRTPTSPSAASSAPTSRPGRSSRASSATSGAASSSTGTRVASSSSTPPLGTNASARAS